MSDTDRLAAIAATLAAGEIPSRGDCEWMLREITRMLPVVWAAQGCNIRMSGGELSCNEQELDRLELAVRLFLLAAPEVRHA